jgi:hypothetical protein
MYLLDAGGQSLQGLFALVKAWLGAFNAQPGSPAPKYFRSKISLPARDSALFLRKGSTTDVVAVGSKMSATRVRSLGVAHA